VTAAPPPAIASAAPRAGDRFGPPASEEAVRRVPVTEWLTECDAGARPEHAEPGDALVGTLVHRLFQHVEFDVTTTIEEDERVARSLVRAEERASVADLDHAVRTAVEGWRRMRAREEVRRILGAGALLHEVPFSMVVPTTDGRETILRGTIDCLVRSLDGAVIVVEFKTGRRRAAHQLQLDVYVQATRALYPGVPVEGVLLYAD
jgi:ATP-dependent exoDNAse (exonuclease V) beta subunit